MKTVFSILALSLISTSASAFEPCAQRLKDAAVAYHAAEKRISISDINVVGFRMGPWTEAVGNNAGSGSVTLKSRNKISFYDVSAQQIGRSSDCRVTEVVATGAQG